MSDSRVAFYESLVRLSIIAVFVFALVVGTVATVSVCRMFMETKMPSLEFITRDLH